MSNIAKAFLPLARSRNAVLGYRVVTKAMSTTTRSVRRSQRIAAKNASVLRVQFCSSAADIRVARIEDAEGIGEFYIDVGEETRPVLSFVKIGNTITLLHTEVPKSLEGRGLGKVLAKAALEYAVENNLRIKVECDFINNFITKYASQYKKYTI